MMHSMRLCCIPFPVIIGDIVGRLFGGAKTGTISPPTTTIPTDLNGPGYPANAKAWALMRDELFAGVDVVPPC